MKFFHFQSRSPLSVFSHPKSIRAPGPYCRLFPGKGGQSAVGVGGAWFAPESSDAGSFFRLASSSTCPAPAEALPVALAGDVLSNRGPWPGLWRPCRSTSCGGAGRCPACPDLLDVQPRAPKDVPMAPAPCGAAPGYPGAFTPYGACGPDASGFCAGAAPYGGYGVDGFCGGVAPYGVCPCAGLG